jgi:hypothetical protein
LFVDGFAGEDESDVDTVGVGELLDETVLALFFGDLVLD